MLANGSNTIWRGEATKIVCKRVKITNHLGTKQKEVSTFFPSRNQTAIPANSSEFMEQISANLEETNECGYLTIFTKTFESRIETIIWKIIKQDTFGRL